MPTLSARTKSSKSIGTKKTTESGRQTRSHASSPNQKRKVPLKDCDGHGKRLKVTDQPSNKAQIEGSSSEEEVDNEEKPGAKRKHPDRDNGRTKIPTQQSSDDEVDEPSRRNLRSRNSTDKPSPESRALRSKAPASSSPTSKNKLQGTSVKNTRKDNRNLSSSKKITSDKGDEFMDCVDDTDQEEEETIDVEECSDDSEVIINKTPKKNCSIGESSSAKESNNASSDNNSDQEIFLIDHKENTKESKKKKSRSGEDQASSGSGSEHSGKDGKSRLGRLSVELERCDDKNEMKRTERSRYSRNSKQIALLTMAEDDEESDSSDIQEIGSSDGDDDEEDDDSEEEMVSGSESDVEVVSDTGSTDDKDDVQDISKLKQPEILKIIRRKDEQIQRLKNEIRYKDDQLAELHEVMDRNMELESKLTEILSSREAYEKEVEEFKSSGKKKHAKKKATESQENEIQVLSVTPVTPEVISLDDNDEEQESSDESVPRKRARSSSGTKPSSKKEKDADSNKKTETKKRKKSKKDDDSEGEAEAEAEPIEAFFVEDDEGEMEEDEQTSKKKKRKGKKDAEVEEEHKTEDEKEEGEDNESPNKGRRDIRKLMSDKKLKAETKAAAIAEKERIKRVRKEHEKHLVVTEVCKKTKAPICKQLVLEFKKGSKVPRVEVNQKLIKKLKPHQVEAVEFMWDCCVESLTKLKDKDEGGGCILAHCMGLGKTLSVVTLVHTLLTHKAVGFKTCLVVCPLNTVLNWKHEWEKWLDKKDRLPTYELASAKNSHIRAKLLSKWHKEGGIMIMGYQIFRILALHNTKSKKKKEIFEKSLLQPGPDVVVCDEGHVLKNDSTVLATTMSKMRTKRRIILTGTPLQNNLIEYHCMVNFVKCNLLGTRREFGNRFVNPITNGQHSDSTPQDVKTMKRRAHVLHEMLSGCVQRRDYSALVKFLPPKEEYVIAVRLSKVQVQLYEKYLDEHRIRGGAGLFSDYQSLMRIWTHPWVLKMDEVRQEKKAALLEMDEDEEEEMEDAESDSNSNEDVSETSPSDTEDQEEEEEEEDSDSVVVTRRTRSTKEASKKDKEKADKKPEEKGTVCGEVIKTWKTKSRGGTDEEVESPEPVVVPPKEEQWWSQYVTEDMEKKIELSGKLVLLFEILRMSEGLGDKVLVFSQSLLSLDLIENMLLYKDEEAQKSRKKNVPRWVRDQDYCRMDGSTQAHIRKKWTAHFNNPKNKRMRLFLISTKAGGLGINLDAANRVIIFDASWNPSHDIQSIFRVYRFGQEKAVYVYRLLAQGTMEEKIYERQITKETLSQRVIDEHQIDRHFTQSDLQELYVFKPDRLDDPNRPKRPLPKIPKDVVLTELLASSAHKEWIVQYHEHDSLLENRPEENLSEEEREKAWEDYEKEKNFIYTYRNQFGSIAGVSNLQPSTSTFRPPSMNLPNMPLTLAQQPRFNFQVQQLPRVVQEIIKYNPNITHTELQDRLRAFLGMHTKFGTQGQGQPGPGVMPYVGQTQRPIPTASLTPQQISAQMRMAQPNITQLTQKQPALIAQPQVVLTNPSMMPQSNYSSVATMPATDPVAIHMAALKNQTQTRLPQPGNVPATRR